MKTIVCSVLLCLLVAGCWSRHLEMVSANDPALPTKLGITDRDWAEIKHLAAEKKGFVLHGAGRVAPGIIDAWFKTPGDMGGTQGGPTVRYEKHEARWVTQHEGDWWTDQATNR